MELSGGRAGEGYGEGVCPSPAVGVRGCHPGKILKFETQFGAIWCIFATNWRFSSFPRKAKHVREKSKRR